MSIMSSVMVGGLRSWWPSNNNVVASHGYSQRRVCRLTQQHRSTQRKPSTRDPRTAVRHRMHEIVATRIRYGYRRVHVMLKREGWSVGRNVVYRLYREEGLVLRTKQPLTWPRR